MGEIEGARSRMVAANSYGEEEDLRNLQELLRNETPKKEASESMKFLNQGFPNNHLRAEKKEVRSDIVYKKRCPSPSAEMIQVFSEQNRKGGSPPKAIFPYVEAFKVSGFDQLSVLSNGSCNPSSSHK